MSGRRERLWLWMLAGPFVLGVAALVVGPGAATLVMSLTDYDLVRSPRFVGLDNFAELLDDTAFRLSLRNSIAFAVIAVPLRLAGSVALALLLHRRFRGVGAYRTAVYLPTVVPDVAYGLVWLWLLNPLYGPINLLLGATGAPTPAWLSQPVAAQAGIILLSLFTLGEGFVITMAARNEIPGELYDIASLDGLNPVAVFRRITLPLLIPTLMLLAARDIVFSFQASFVPALIVTGGGPPPFATTYLPVFVYRTGFEYLRYGYAAAATVVMLGVTALMLVAQLSIVRSRRLGELTGS